MKDFDRYEELADESWKIILESVNRLREENQTLQEIAELLGIKNRALVSEWINGNREIPKTAFAQVLRYLNVLGYSINGEVIQKKSDINSISHSSELEIEKYKAELIKFKSELENYKIEITNYKNKTLEYKSELENYKDELKKIKKENSKLKEKLDIIQDITKKAKKKKK